ncbi:MAG: hypothetical protein ACI8Z1_000867, partial [Candidatus Azotimanducaceae bacterium]
MVEYPFEVYHKAMNKRFSKGIGALLVILLSLQAPVTLALSCADHGSINAVATAMPMSEADCHSKMTQMAPQPA